MWKSAVFFLSGSLRFRAFSVFRALSVSLSLDISPGNAVQPGASPSVSFADSSLCTRCRRASPLRLTAFGTSPARVGGYKEWIKI